MTDIVERLRFCEHYKWVPLMREAADEIERLRALGDKLWTGHVIEREDMKAEIERLRTALNELTTEITQSSVLVDNISLAKFERACRALEHKP